MQISRPYIHFGMLIASAYPISGLTEEPSSNITIICSPGYSYSPQQPEPISKSFNNSTHPFWSPLNPLPGVLPGITSNSDGSVQVNVPGTGGVNVGKPPVPVPDLNIPIENGLLAIQNYVVQTVTTGNGVIESVINNQVKVIQETANNTVKTVVKGVVDIAATYEKAWNDINKQAVRSFNDITEAGAAIADFVVKDTRAKFDILQNSANQLQEGKIIDAMWNIGVSPLHATEKNFFEATQKSKLLDMAAASAASVYGGPAGAAAYAAWKTLQITGDVNLAFRMGLVAAIQQQGGTFVEGMPGATISEVVKKAAIAGTVGGIAVAAAGGDEKAITDAFLKSSGNVLVQNAQNSVKSVMDNNPNAAAAAQVVGCISAKNVNCLADIPYVKDATGKLIEQVPPSVADIKNKAEEVVGEWTTVQNEAERKANEIMTMIPKLPDSNIIPLANNSVVITWTFGSQAEIKNGLPTVLISAIGDNSPFVSKSDYTPIK
ncbi:TPA: hypothetical protein ACOEDE_004140 [Enterobacter kobei]